MRFHRPVALLALLFAGAAGATAPAGVQGFGKAGKERAVVHGATIEPATAAPGDAVNVVIDLEILPGYHAYAPTTPSEYAVKLDVALADAARFATAGPLAFPDPRVHVDEVLNETFHELAGRFTIRQPISVPADGAGEVKVSGTVEGQACDESTCEEFHLPFQAVVKVVAPASSTIADSPTGGAPSAGAAKQSLWQFILSAIAAGLVSLLMPCVFPMIPITVSVFTKQAAGNRAGSIRLAAIYGLSIVLVFTGIGVLCSLLLDAGAANAIGSNPWVNLALGALFVVFGFSLLGAFELRLPNFLIQGAAEAQEKASGVVQVVLMAVVFTLTSFTCTVPFVGTLLVQASKGETMWPLLGMLAFSGTFALPFFLLALAPTLMTSLPSAGSWMNAAKITMGLLELAFALKFLSNSDLVWELGILTRPFYLACWVTIGAVTTLYLLGRLRVGYDTAEEPIGPYRITTAIAMGSLTLYLATGFLGTRFGDTIEGLLPPGTDVYGPDGFVERSSGGSNGAAEPVFPLNGRNPKSAAAERADAAARELGFLDDYGTALAKAKSEKKALFIDFTGITCVNCRAMEEKVFPRADVREYLDQFVRVQLYVDRGPNKSFNANLQLTKFEQSAQPYYAVIDPENEETLGYYPGYAGTEEKVQEFIAVLKDAAEKYARRSR